MAGHLSFVARSGFGVNATTSSWLPTAFSELEANRPELVIDTSVARYRYYDKYPLADFAPLANFLARDFVFVKLLEDDRGRPIAALWQRR